MSKTCTAQSKISTQQRAKAPGSGLLLAVALLGLGLGLAAGPAWGAPAAWRVQTSPDPSPSYDTFNAVASSSGGPWAVGYNGASSNALHTLIARHTRSGWVKVASPNRAGIDRNYLDGVAATSSTNAWAVGYWLQPPALALDHEQGVLVLHWDGTAWVKQSAPRSKTNGVEIVDQLSGVAALSAKNAWTVGAYGNEQCSGMDGCAVRPLVEHWNGSAWTLQATPNTGAGWLFGVAAVTNTHVWAVGDALGRPLVLRWTGSKWTSMSVPHPGSHGKLLGVSAVSAGNAWAVGSYVSSNHRLRTLVLHYDGTSWKRVACPNVGTAANVLTAVHATSANNIWAVGHHGGKPLLEHYNGTSWSVQTLPKVGKAALAGVAGSYAVGNTSSTSGTHTLVLHHS